MSNNSIRSIDRTLSDANNLGQSGPGRNGNLLVLHILQSSKTEALPSDCLISYPGHSLEESYSSAEMLSVYSIARANWVITSGGEIHFLYSFPEMSDHSTLKLKAKMNPLNNFFEKRKCCDLSLLISINHKNK